MAAAMSAVVVLAAMTWVAGEAAAATSAVVAVKVKTWSGQEVCSGFALAALATRSLLGLCSHGLALPTHNNQTAKQWLQKLLQQRCHLSAAVAVAGGSSGGSSDILLYCSLLVPCTTWVPLSLSFNSVLEKTKSYLGIQSGTFFVEKKENCFTLRT